MHEMRAAGTCPTPAIGWLDSYREHAMFWLAPLIALLDAVRSGALLERERASRCYRAASRRPVGSSRPVYPARRGVSGYEGGQRASNAGIPSSIEGATRGRGDFEIMQTLMLGLLSGALVGLILGLIGGGGSILAVPMLIYVVGITSPHVAIGTSAVAVAVSAAINLVLHARQGTVKWRCATLFSVVGGIGAWGGSILGKATDGKRLLALFGAVMIVVGGMMLRRRRVSENADVRLDITSVTYLAPRLVTTGLVAGLISGYFGIGGGFLIVPALLFATNMSMIAAVGSSLLAVSAFGATTAVSYSLSGLVNWPLAGVFVTGGALGGVLGSRSAVQLAGRRGVLTTTFAILVIGVGGYILLRGIPALFGRAYH